MLKWFVGWVVGDRLERSVWIEGSVRGVVIS